MSDLVKIHIVGFLMLWLIFCSIDNWAATWENRIFAYAKTKTQISFVVTAKLISVFVFTTLKIQSLYFLNPKFQVSSHLQWLSSRVCVGPGRNPRRPVFWRRGSIGSVLKFKGSLFWSLSVIVLSFWTPRSGQTVQIRPGPEVIKFFFNLNSAEHEIYPAHKC